MTHKPEVGRNVYNEVLVRGRNATNVARRALNTLLDEQPGPQSTALLIAKVSLSLAQIEAVLNELDKIGREAKQTSRKNGQS